MVLGSPKQIVLWSAPPLLATLVLTGLLALRPQAEVAAQRDVRSAHSAMPPRSRAPARAIDEVGQPGAGQSPSAEMAVETAPSPRRVTIGASGDVLFHTRVVAAAEAHEGFDRLFAGLRSIIGDDEIAFANLETPLSESRTPMRSDPPLLGAPPSAASALARAGLDVMSVANNHAWDQRDTGMVETLRALEDAGVVAVGAAPEQNRAAGPVFIDRGDLRVAFVAFTVILQGHPGTRRPAVRIAQWDERMARRVLAEAREGADLVVASMHWGLAYRHDSRSEQRSRAEFLVEHGADLVLGHGPHVLQPFERLASPRGEAAVIYSLGNLVSNQGYRYRYGRRERGVERALREPATRDGIWLRVPLEVSESGELHVLPVDAVPLWTDNNFWDEERRRADSPDIRIVPMATIANEDLRGERMRSIQQVLGESAHVLIN